ncbi:PREDICTED: major royal jelly protein 3-like [Vollenhovia emeryi]|uniref:major royal jelly protein 3-like n=1 Tax=Vollenhovia emeryi TaxID=411798 RepID=UPI0005F4E579|nr:PREDICTED: major royal jelly protein 3-like [Vollenhovia emeryi]
MLRKMRYFLLVMSILSMETMSAGKMRLEYQWKYLDLLWESPQQKQEAIDSGSYNPSVAFLYDVDKAPDGRVFITASIDKGIPVSVMTVTNKQGEGGPLLRPYPDWSWYRNTTDCNGLAGGVYQIDIKCNHLFIVDGGRSGDNQLCLPQLLIFDLSTDKLVRRVRVNIGIAHNKTGRGLLASLSIYAPNCRNVEKNAVVFMGDVEGAGLVVYNGRTAKMCRIESDFMKPTNNGFVLDNVSYPLTDTIYGLALIGESLYYAALAGNKIYKIEYSKLMECSGEDIARANQRTKLAGVLNGQTAAITSDRCVLFFSDITKTSIMCADATKAIDSKNKAVVAHDPKLLQFPSGIKIRERKLFVLSNKYHIHLMGSSSPHDPRYQHLLNLNETNFRVFSMPIKEIEKNTNCFSSCN